MEASPKLTRHVIGKSGPDPKYKHTRKSLALNERASGETRPNQSSELGLHTPSQVRPVNRAQVEPIMDDS
jgi:hypothetical protein